MEYTRVGRVCDFPQGKGRRVHVGDRRVAVFRIEDDWFAIQDACPHMGASLADGRIEAGRVVCLWHAHAFDLGTGRSDRRAGACARVFPIKIEADEVLIGDPPETSAKTEPDPDDEWIRWDDRFLK